MAKDSKKPVVIKDTPQDIMDDNNLQSSIMHHVNAFGFEHIIENVVEAYRVRARTLSKKADELERKYNG